VSGREREKSNVDVVGALTYMWYHHHQEREEKRTKQFKGCSPVCVTCLALLFLITASVFALRILMQIDGNPFATDKSCANTAHTVSHTEWIADDQGKVCFREDFDNDNGCCKKSVTSFERGCNLNCNETACCCNIYEFCVACCMSPFSKPVVDQFKKETRDLIYTSLLSDTDSFEFCKAKCRTSSHSVIGENKYRSIWKHCYGGTPPPLQIETTVVDTLSITERRPTTTRSPSGRVDEEGPAEALGGAAASEQRAGRSLSEPLEFDIPAEESPEVQEAAKDPDTFVALSPLPEEITGKSRVTSAAGTISGRIWWLNTAMWTLQRSDFMIAVSITCSTVLFLLRRPWW